MATKVLVLNQDYQAISICTPQRAFILVFLNKAEMVCDLKAKVLRSVESNFKYPSIIRLHRFISLPFKKVALSRTNIFKRDGYQCVYCGTRENLSLDHVIPRSKGGRDSWHNLVTACQKCNTEKGDRTPEQADLQMLCKPFRPSFIMYLREFNGKVQDDWKPYLLMN
ncbi:MAG TPA: HNH endonuclease [Bacteroidetes bacterium]|nr:HNH endonuclease [Bacteroidota bacterium]